MADRPEEKKDDENEDEETDDAEMEGTGQKAGKIPYVPTAQEVADHEATHVPFRSWCSICVRAKANTPGHRRRRPFLREVPKFPRISLDYMYMHPQSME